MICLCNFCQSDSVENARMSFYASLEWCDLLNQHDFPVKRLVKLVKKLGGQQASMQNTTHTGVFNRDEYWSTEWLIRLYYDLLPMKM